MGCCPVKNSKKKEIFPVTESFPSEKSELKIEAGLFIGKRLGSIRDIYKIGPSLGSGSFSSIRIGIHKLNKQKRAIKIIPKAILPKDPKEISIFYNEINILSKIDHPNIVKIYEYFEDEAFYYLVNEYISGGELFDYILKQKSLSENTAAHFMKQLFSGVLYCHSKNIVHRDLNPANLLLDRESNDAVLKIIDFGTSKVIDFSTKLSQNHTSAYYTAPEVIDNDYNEKCDLWSCGVILYVILSGKLPFNGKNDKEILNNVKVGKYNLSTPEWEFISDSAKALIKDLLKVNPHKRISAAQALNHRWINDHSTHSFRRASIKELAFINLKSYHASNKLQNAVMSFLSSNLITKEEQEKLTENFKKMDKDGDGKLNKDELLTVLRKKMDYEEALGQVEKIMHEVDVNNSGFIDYTEFLMACSEKKSLLCMRNLEQAFELFDLDKNGKINANELKEILGASQFWNENIWMKLISEVDLNGDGEIDVNEFRSMMIKFFSY